MNLEQILRLSHDWAVRRIEVLDACSHGDARALAEEFAEWMDPAIPDHDIFSLAPILGR